MILLVLLSGLLAAGLAVVRLFTEVSEAALAVLFAWFPLISLPE
jgi:hypothetical protein